MFMNKIILSRFESTKKRVEIKEKKHDLKTREC